MDINKISATTKNIMYLIMLISSGAFAYFQIFANRDAVIKQRDQFEKEFRIQAQRSDKRYKRAMKLSSDYEQRLRKLEAYMNQSKGGCN